MAEELLRDGKTFVIDLYSEKKRKFYSAYIAISDDGQRTSYSLEFGKGK